MARNISHRILSCLLVLSATTGLSLAQAEALDAQLEKTLAAQAATFVGYETMAQEQVDADAEKYLVLDFRFSSPQSDQFLQASVHTICQAVLLNNRLISTLSADGYNRLAVAFDHRYQYDCF